MITRVYADNFRCFSNFEWNPDKLSLLLGENGSGKSSLYDAIQHVAAFALGLADAASFRLQDNRCAWDKRPEQTFELALRRGEEEFKYRLVLLDAKEPEVIAETVHCGDKLLYQREPGRVLIYNEDGSPGGSFPFSGARSVIGMLSSGGGVRKLQEFAEELRNIVVFRPDPLSIRTVAEGHVEVASPNMVNLVGWLFHLGAMSADFSSRLLLDLKEALAGLQTYSLPPAGINSRAMQLYFSAGDSAGKGAEFPLFLDQLSHGQKMLLAIYTILHGIVGTGATVLIDEPDNYLSSREIQPWLRAMEDRLAEGEGQVLLISHHPEALDYLAANNGFLFYREDNGPVRVKRVDWEPQDSLTPAEAAARGWLA